MKLVHSRLNQSLAIVEPKCVTRMVLHRSLSNGDSAVVKIQVFTNNYQRAQVAVFYEIRKGRIRHDGSFRVSSVDAQVTDRRHKVYTQVLFNRGDGAKEQAGGWAEDFAIKLRARNFWMASYQFNGLYIAVQDTWRIPLSEKPRSLIEREMNAKFSWINE